MSSELNKSESEGIDRQTEDVHAGAAGGGRKKAFNPIKSLKKLFTGSNRRALTAAEREGEEFDATVYKARSTTDVIGAVLTAEQSFTTDDDEDDDKNRRLSSISTKQLSMSADSIFTADKLQPVKYATQPVAHTAPHVAPSVAHSTQSVAHSTRPLTHPAPHVAQPAVQPVVHQQVSGQAQSHITNTPALDKRTVLDNRLSVHSVDNSTQDNDMEEDFFKDKWHSSVNASETVKDKEEEIQQQQQSVTGEQEVDFSVVRRHASLKSSAVAHRLAVKPKNKRVASLHQHKIQQAASLAHDRPAVLIEILAEIEETESCTQLNTAHSQDLQQSRCLAAEAAQRMREKMEGKTETRKETSSSSSSSDDKTNDDNHVTDKNADKSTDDARVVVMRRSVMKDVSSDDKTSRRQTIAVTSDSHPLSEPRVTKRSSVHHDKISEVSEGQSEYSQIFARIQRKSSQRTTTTAAAATTTAAAATTSATVDSEGKNADLKTSEPSPRVFDRSLSTGDRSLSTSEKSLSTGAKVVAAGEKSSIAGERLPGTGDRSLSTDVKTAGDLEAVHKTTDFKLGDVKSVETKPPQTKTTEAKNETKMIETKSSGEGIKTDKLVTVNQNKATLKSDRTTEPSSSLVSPLYVSPTSKKLTTTTVSVTDKEMAHESKSDQSENNSSSAMSALRSTGSKIYGGLKSDTAINRPVGVQLKGSLVKEVSSSPPKTSVLQQKMNSVNESVLRSDVGLDREQKRESVSIMNDSKTSVVKKTNSVSFKAVSSSSTTATTCSSSSSATNAATNTTITTTTPNVSISTSITTTATTTPTSVIKGRHTTAPVSSVSGNTESRTPSGPKISAPSDPSVSALSDPKVSAPGDPKVSAPSDHKVSALSDPKTVPNSDHRSGVTQQTNQSVHVHVGSSNVSTRSMSETTNGTAKTASEATKTTNEATKITNEATKTTSEATKTTPATRAPAFNVQSSRVAATDKLPSPLIKVVTNKRLDSSTESGRSLMSKSLDSSSAELFSKNKLSGSNVESVSSLSIATEIKPKVSTNTSTVPSTVSSPAVSSTVSSAVSSTVSSTVVSSPVVSSIPSVVSSNVSPVSSVTKVRSPIISSSGSVDGEPAWFAMARRKTKDWQEQKV